MLTLTPRQLEILRLITDGLTSKEIGERLYLSRHTVENHLTCIYERLGVHNRTQAVVRAFREGLLD